MDKLISIILLSALLTAPSIPSPIPSQTTQVNETLPAPQPIYTQSRFEIKTETQTTVLPQKTVVKDDPEAETGEEKVVDEGEDGEKVTTFKISYYEGVEDSRAITSEKITPPKDKIILQGTKIVWRNLDTGNQTVRYWKKIHVYATHYDSRCPGCDDYTAIGLKAGKGVIAVDPKIIKLGSKVYIPGYGPAIAGDTGGSIKGHIIDLGFDDAKTAGWSAKFIDIYLL